MRRWNSYTRVLLVWRILHQAGQELAREHPRLAGIQPLRLTTPLVKYNELSSREQEEQQTSHEAERGRRGSK